MNKMIRKSMSFSNLILRLVVVLVVAQSSSIVVGAVDNNNQHHNTVHHQHDKSNDDNSQTNTSLTLLELCQWFPTWRVNTVNDDQAMDEIMLLLNDNDISISKLQDGEVISLRETCSKLFNYYPHTYQLFNGSSWEFPHHDRQWIHTLQDCMDDAQQQRMQQYYEEIIRDDNNNEIDNNKQKSTNTKLESFWKSLLHKYPFQSPTVSMEYPSMEILAMQHEDHNELPPVPPVAIIVDHALHIREVETIQDLKVCIHEHYNFLLEHRPFNPQYDDGGNDCTFLGAFLQWYAPGVAIKIRNVGHTAWNHGVWGQFIPPDTQLHHSGYVSPLQAGIRTSGHLAYDGWKELGPHKDNLSLYTVLIMLSDPQDYVGGELHMEVDRSNGIPQKQKELDQQHPPLIIKPNRYSAVVFMADENTHQILTIDGGQRETIGTEFWEYTDAPFGIMRPSPEMYHNFQRTHDWWNFN